MENKDKPQERRLGWLKNGNPPGDFSKAPRCGAKTRRGTPCQCPAMKNGRCRLHGGKSPGAPKGNRNAWKHGFYSAASIAERRAMRILVRSIKELMK